MRLLVFIAFLGITITTSAQRKVYGKISDGLLPLELVSIENRSSGVQTTTDKAGFYQIETKTGDILLFSLKGYLDVEIQIEDVTRVLNLVMNLKVNELDEVIVQAKKSRTSQKSLQQEYKTNKEIFLTAQGYRNMEGLAGGLDFMDGDKIYFTYPCILDFLRRFNSTVITGSCTEGNGSVFLRRALGTSLYNTQSVLYDIDGMIFTTTPMWLDTQNIDRIAILRSLSSTVAYGSLASGGVILINTKSVVPLFNEVVGEEPNFSGSNAVKAASLERDNPRYLIDIKEATNTQDALRIFKTYKERYSSSPYFYLDMAHFFGTELNNRNVANQILLQGNFLFDDNPVLLKALAYVYDRLGESERSLKIYQKVYQLRPTYAQSYRDLAQSYSRNKSPNKAVALYSRYAYIIQEKMLTHPVSDFDTLMIRENRQLILKHGKDIIPDYQGLFDLENDDFVGNRLVLEWNDSEAEFEIEFVNPQNQNYIWIHSLKDSSEQIKKEKSQGYSAKEFLLDGSLPGVWKINVKYLGNKSLTPTYFKLTQFINFGTPLQSEKISFFKVFTKGVNYELTSVVDGGQVAQNKKP